MLDLCYFVAFVFLFLSFSVNIRGSPPGQRVEDDRRGAFQRVEEERRAAVAERWAAYGSTNAAAARRGGSDEA